MEVKQVNDILSSVICYIMGEFNEEQLRIRLSELNTPNEVAEHIETIVIFNKNLI